MKNQKEEKSLLGISRVKQTPLQIFIRFLKFGLLAWGGPIAQIAMIREELVEEEKWISKEQFNRTLAVYQVLPGPEAHELCVYFGMIAGGRWGGFLAGLGFMLPGFLLMLLLTWFYIQYGTSSLIFQFIFAGFQTAVIALIFMGTFRIGKHSLLNIKLLIIALISALAYFIGIIFFIVLPLAGIAYVILMKKNKVNPTLLIILLFVSCSSFSFQQFYPKQISVSTFVKSEISDSSPLTIFYSGLKGGLLTFGGAYTVIPFIQEDAVINNNWMTNEQFLDGIALSGILPAPLIIFTTFVGYFAGGWIGALIITAAIFLPAFGFTIIGHNYIQKVIENKALHNFLYGVTAGVIGLIAVTAIQLFRTAITDVLAIAIFLAALSALYFIKSKFTIVFVIMGSGILSLIYNLML